MPEAIDSDIRDELRTIALGGSVPASARPIEPRVAAAAILGALIALDAPPAAYLRHVADALATGMTTGELLAILTTVTPHVGAPRATAAAAEIMVALGLPFDEAL